MDCVKSFFKNRYDSCFGHFESWEIIQFKREMGVEGLEVIFFIFFSYGGENSVGILSIVMFYIWYVIVLF